MVAVDPAHTVAACEAPESVGKGLIDINTAEELSSEQTPLLTTALNQVFAVRLPIVEPASVVDVDKISIGDVKTWSVDFCHFTTLPVFPLNVRSAGEVL